MRRVSILLLICLLCMVFITINQPDQVNVPILMFHDITPAAGGTWGISEANFRSKMEFLLEEGYTPVSFSQLVDYVDGESGLPDKPVCITLDDGYYSNYKYVLPIAIELEIPVTVFMTCSTVRPDGIAPYEPDEYYSKMNYSELAVMEASRFVQIQSHTYAMHGENTTYTSAVRDNSLPRENESEHMYKEFFSIDCSLAERTLESVGVKENIVFSYPSGKHNKWAEEVLRNRGYRASVTTDYGHKNTVRVGDSESLFLLGRMNVNDGTTDDDLLKYLDRDAERVGEKGMLMDWFETNVLEAYWYGLKEVLTVFFTSMIPVLELRAAIMFGPEHNMPWIITYIVAVLGNTLPVPFIILFIRAIFSFMRKIPHLDKLVDKMEEKADKHKDAVQKYAGWGLYLFVAIPLPGTGAWTGSLVAAMLNMRFSKAFPTIFGGVATAGVIMTFFYYFLGKMFPSLTLWHVIAIVLAIVVIILVLTWLINKIKKR